MNKNWQTNFNSWRMRIERSVVMMMMMKMMTMIKVRIVNQRMIKGNNCDMTRGLFIEEDRSD